jgi:hypothetical protein
MGIGSRFTAARNNNRNQCAHCGGKFGLVRQRKAFMQFCSVRCLEAHRGAADVEDEQARRAIEIEAAHELTAPELRRSS